MQLITYHKLVRDRIPEIIKRSGKTASVRILPESEYLVAITQKLNEEVAEYLESGEIEELADILEVLHALIAARGTTWEEIETLRSKKKEERGGFDQKIELISVESE